MTSALPYANGQLHFGHIAGAYLPADCYARFERLQGKDVLYICGSDEYGVAITLSADMAKRSPQEHVDIFHKINKDLFDQLDFSFDHYSRTTWKGHIPTTQQFFLDLLANGYIEERVTDQLYSPQDNRFLADRYVVGTCPKCSFTEARGDECQRCGASYEATDLKNPRSKLTNALLILKATKHWFLLFDKFKDQLSTWLDQKNWKANVVNFAKSYVDDLKPRAITRDGDWGVPIPLPGTEGKVLYVWFDAPIGYISMTKEWAQLQGKPDAWEKYWLDPQTHYVEFIGKDNIPFHAVFFPAMEMGQNIPYKKVDELPANEFLNLEGRQFSKSEGWTIDLSNFFNHFTSDQIRYTLAANAPENQDSEFTWKDFQIRCNSELLGKYGNLANRALVFIQNKVGGKVPSKKHLSDTDHTFLTQLNQLVKEAADAYRHFHLRRASQLMMQIAQAGNVYFDERKPWALAKAPETFPQMESTLYCCVECLKKLALVSSPIIPAAAQKLWEMLGFTTTLSKENWDKVMSDEIPEGRSLPQPHVLFKRVENELIEAQENQLKALVK
ncbi:MAG TPA: methionine--tRNA ligase [Rhabdochlamydiaceae bacterium]|nr:methionine--tRNA ligase [Rhabdochlamydiaceae bacterium]